MPWICRVGHADHNNVGTDLSEEVLAELALIANPPAKELGPVAWLVQRLIGDDRQRWLFSRMQTTAPLARRLAHLPAPSPSAPPPWRVMVTCPLGHSNIFSAGPADAPPAHDVAGQPPTNKDALAAASAGYLTPDKQVDRVVGRAQTLIGATSIFGTVFTAFGFLGASRLQSAGAGTGALIIAAVACLAVSLGFAFAALVVERGHMDVGDPDSLWLRFNDIIMRRWRLTSYSSYLFVLAIILTLVAAMLVFLTTPAPSATHT